MIAFKRLPAISRKMALSQMIKRTVVPFQVLYITKKEKPLEYHFTKPESPDCFKADLQLAIYLRLNFTPKNAKKLEKCCQEMVNKLCESRHLPMDDLSTMVQNFYTYISKQAARMGPKTDDYSEEALLEHVESLICVRAYGILFCTRSDEETIDLSLHQRIRSCYWVTQGFLETPLDFASDMVEELLNEAMAEIEQMNSYKRPKEKFECLINCSTKICEAIQVSTKRPVSADEFLPVLIYVILKSNPSLIHSNLSFIHRFSVEFRTYSGETGYYFTNLCSAVRFIQDMDAESLKMSKDSFDNKFVSIDAHV